MTKILLLPETHTHYKLKFNPKKHIIRINATSDCELHRDGDEDIDDISCIQVYNRTSTEDEKQEIIWECYMFDDAMLYPKVLVKIAKYIASGKGAFE